MGTSGRTAGLRRARPHRRPPSPGADTNDKPPKDAARSARAPDSMSSPQPAPPRPAPDRAQRRGADAHRRPPQRPRTMSERDPKHHERSQQEPDVERRSAVDVEVCTCALPRRRTTATRATAHDEGIRPWSAFLRTATRDRAARSSPPPPRRARPSRPASRAAAAIAAGSGRAAGGAQATPDTTRGTRIDGAGMQGAGGPGGDGISKGSAAIPAFPWIPSGSPGALARRASNPALTAVYLISRAGARQVKVIRRQ